MTAGESYSRWRILFSLNKRTFLAAVVAEKKLEKDPKGANPGKQIN